MSERTMPPAAAALVHKPTRVPSPMATSAKAMNRPNGTATCSSGATSVWTGLKRAAPDSCAWIEAGLVA